MRFYDEKRNFVEDAGDPMRLCKDYAEQGTGCMRMGVSPVSWCENCCYNVQIESNRAIQIVENIERNPEKFDASARASAELMRWLVWDRFRRVTEVSEKWRQECEENANLRSRIDKPDTL